MFRAPWEIEPKLRKEYLYELASIIRDVRREALSLYDPEEGDGPWSLGCRVYERTINTIEQKAVNLPWLSVIRKRSLYFVMLVDEVPVRFYTGPPDKPSARTLKQGFPEVLFTQLELPWAESEWFWRISVDTDQDGQVLKITVAQYNENGNFQNPWEVPLSEPIPAITLVSGKSREAAQLEKPLLIPKGSGLLGETENAG